MSQYSPNEQVAVTVLESWNSKEYDKAMAVLADDFEVVEVANGDTYRGADGLLAEFTKWHTAMSDGVMHIKTVIGKGDLVAIETLVTGTHDGPFATGDGDLPPTGNAIEFPMCTIATIREGKERQERHYFDLESIMTQLGASK